MLNEVISQIKVSGRCCVSVQQSFGLEGLAECSVVATSAAARLSSNKTLTHSSILTGPTCAIVVYGLTGGSGVSSATGTRVAAGRETGARSTVTTWHISAVVDCCFTVSSDEARSTAAAVAANTVHTRCAVPARPVLTVVRYSFAECSLIANRAATSASTDVTFTDTAVSAGSSSAVVRYRLALCSGVASTTRTRVSSSRHAGAHSSVKTGLT